MESLPSSPQKKALINRLVQYSDILPVSLRGVQLPQVKFFLDQ